MVLNAPNSTEIWSSGYWYAAPHYNGPWMVVAVGRVPPPLHRFGWEEIRRHRDLEYREFHRDERHYHGRWHVPEARRESPLLCPRHVPFWRWIPCRQLLLADSLFRIRRFRYGSVIAGNGIFKEPILVPQVAFSAPPADILWHFGPLMLFSLSIPPFFPSSFRLPISSFRPFSSHSARAPPPRSPGRSSWT